ncbi:MAG: hypothetical protein QM784_34600 [Polyangiaceae bacterium]
MPNNGKQWRAFLSVTDDGTGKTAAAIDRIGEGPWYNRLGRLFAEKKSDLISTRPIGIDSEIANDLPNEDGVLNHDPDGTGQVDNHDTLTGSNANGALYGATATCSDWTSSDADTSKRPRVGHTWPTGGTTGGTRPGGSGGSMAHWICPRRVRLCPWRQSS